MGTYAALSDCLNYQLATPALAATARQTSVYKAQRFSDHAPLIIDYDRTI